MEQVKICVGVLTPGDVKSPIDHHKERSLDPEDETVDRARNVRFESTCALDRNGLNPEHNTTVALSPVDITESVFRKCEREIAISGREVVEKLWSKRPMGVHFLAQYCEVQSPWWKAGPRQSTLSASSHRSNTPVGTLWQRSALLVHVSTRCVRKNNSRHFD